MKLKLKASAQAILNYNYYISVDNQFRREQAESSFLKGSVLREAMTTLRRETGFHNAIFDILDVKFMGFLREVLLEFTDPVEEKIACYLLKLATDSQLVDKIKAIEAKRLMDEFGIDVSKKVNFMKGELMQKTFLIEGNTWGDTYWGVHIQVNHVGLPKSSNFVREFQKILPSFSQLKQGFKLGSYNIYNQDPAVLTEFAISLQALPNFKEVVEECYLMDPYGNKVDSNFDFNFSKEDKDWLRQMNIKGRRVK